VEPQSSFGTDRACPSTASTWRPGARWPRAGTRRPWCSRTSGPGPLASPWARRRWLTPAQDAAGLPRSGCHALRRSDGPALHGRGVAARDARELMGHSTILMTADTYQREGSAEALLARLERAVEG